MEKKFEFKVVLESPTGEITELHPVAYFSKNPKTYGNGYYMKLENAGLGFCDVFDCRYDNRLHEDDLPSFVRTTMKEIWTGEDGSWKIKELTEICY